MRRGKHKPNSSVATSNQTITPTQQATLHNKRVTHSHMAAEKRPTIGCFTNVGIFQQAALLLLRTQE